MGLCGKNCDRCIFKERYCGGCSMCEASLCNKNCSSCSALCASRPESAQLIKKVLEYNLQMKSNNRMNLTTHIPILPDRFKVSPKWANGSIAAIRGKVKVTA